VIRLVARVLLVLLLLSGTASEGSSQSLWFKYEGNPVMDVGPTGTWDAGNVFALTVVPVRDTLRMWYTGNSPTSVDRIGCAWSTDGGVTWTKHRSNPVLTPTLPWENGFAYEPFVMYADTMFKMWYTGDDGSGQIGYATSADGLAWVKSVARAVLLRGSSGWDEKWIASPSVVGPDGTGRFRMWYEGWDHNEVHAQIGYATAINESTWTKHAGVSPVLQPGPSGSWDGGYVRFPTVLHDSETYHMWYSGGTEIFRHLRVGHATSLDGIAWTKDPANPVLGPTVGGWDSVGACGADILLENETYHMWYGGHDGTSLRTGYAISPKGISFACSHQNGYNIVGMGGISFTVKTEKQEGLRSFAAIMEVPEVLKDGQTARTFHPVKRLQLVDDGLHGDQLQGDGVFANWWIAPEEDIYFVSLEIGMEGKRGLRKFIHRNATAFTTAGPLSLESFEILDSKRLIPGDSVHVRLVLRNQGRTRIAPSVTVFLSGVDSSIESVACDSRAYGDILPGGSSRKTEYHALRISPDAPTGSAVQVKVTIASMGEPFWYDSFTLRIVPPWWKTQWALGVFALLLALTLFAVYRFQLSRIRLKSELKMKSFEAEKLRELDETKSRFFANISHEFRTPLTLIEGPLKQLKSDGSVQNAQVQYDMMLRNTERLERLVNQLLDLSRIDAGQLKLHAQCVDICQIIRGIAAAFESLAAHKGINYTVRVSRDRAMGWIDQDAVEKIVGNLLSNAFKFTPTGGTVEVRVDLTPHSSPSPKSGEGGKGGEVIRVVVTDSGIGIPTDQVDKVFDRFYQVDSSRTREHTGSGIGLSLTKELVELHHGEITVQSEVGCGSVFSVVLPLGKEQWKPDEILESKQKEPLTASGQLPSEDNPPISTASALDEAGNHRPLLLIVEDNTDMRVYIRGHLGAEYRVLEAANGTIGLEEAIESVPDLVISDVMMPKMDGYELCRALKNDERTSHIPIILLTAKAATENKLEGLETGADDYLLKPFEPKELQVRIKNLIDIRRRLRERFKVSVPLKPGEIAVTSMDDAFLKKVMAAVEQHMGQEQFHTDELAREVGLSRVQLHRKLTALTSQSPGEFVRYLRLHRAMDLLTKDAATVSEIAYRVGFSDPSSFAKAFHKQFGKAPSEVSKAAKGVAS
jgi:signal transduction histidine kinase/DNA-binding response OmpR family regulator/predicted GH43/DUF377 family glycosyl hydrolase